MKRTNAEGHDSNLYTAGNPALNIPATVVGAEELNQIQEELCNVVEAAGLTVDQTGANDEQVIEGLNIIVANGGGGTTTPSSPNKKLNLLDNQTTYQNLTDILFSNLTEYSVFINYHVQRLDDSVNAYETGVLICHYDEVAAVWELSQETYTPAAQTQAVGVTFNLTTGGQLQYKTTNYGGTNYDGKLRASIKKVLA